MAHDRWRAVMMLVPFVLLVVLVVVAQPDAPGAPSGVGQTTHDGHGDDTQQDMQHDMQMVAASAGSYAASAPVLPTKGWTARADAAAKGHRAAAAIDGRPATTWITPVKAKAPHVLTIDTKSSRALSGLRLTPERAKAARRVGRYTVQVSVGGRWRTVTTGLWADNGKVKTASFAAVTTRFVRLLVTNVHLKRRPVAVAEVALLGAPLGPPLARTGWSASADSQDPSKAPALVLDGNPATYWHTKTTDDPPPQLPHAIVIDTTAPRLLSAISYTPRQDGQGSGRIGAYVVETSLDGVTWRRATAGTWADDATTKTVPIPTVTARFVRLRATSEAGRRGPWSSAAEINLYGPAAGPSLDPTGWTVKADAATSANPPARVLDGNQATIWQTPTARGSKGLPHTLTIDTRTRYRFTGLTYVPRQDSSPNGIIGRYRIDVSDNGTTWATRGSGTWADDRTVKTARITATAARYVRLVALTEAGGRGPWTSAAEVRLNGTVVDPGTRGTWGPVIGLPIVPTSAILLPNDKVLTFSAAFATDFDIDLTNVTQISIIDLKDLDGGQPGQREVSNTGHQMFCTGLSILEDGRVLITGGSTSSNSTIYDPVADTFTTAPQMKVGRGYQTSVTLSNGGVFTIGGSWSGGIDGVNGVNKNGEVLDEGATSWRSLPGTSNAAILTDDGEAGNNYRRDNHAWLFAASGGRVFHAGPSNQMNWFETTGSGSTISAGDRGDARDQMNGNAVMYDTDKILTLGGSPAYGYSDATDDAHTIDISAGYPQDPVVTKTGSMAQRRAFVNSVVLPDASVLVTGGQSYAVPFTDTTAQLSSELWTPSTGTFRTLAAEAVPRTYHSFSLLLADGRVLSGGGGLTPNSEVNHPDVQVMTPPYLLEKDGSLRPRPAITSTVPATVAAGGTVRVTTDRPVASWAMVRVGTSTHSINSDQRRFVPATTAVAPAGSNTVDLTVPADRGVSVPGPYLLFALDANGTPSVAKWIRVP